MSRRGLQTSVTRTVVAIALLLADGTARAATISQLDTTPKVILTATNLLGLPVAVAVDTAGHVYVMTHRGWIYSLSPTSTPAFMVQASMKMPGADTSNNSVDYPAVALAVTATDVYAARNNGTILHYDSSLNLQQCIEQKTPPDVNCSTASVTVTGTLVGLTVDSGGNVYAAYASGTIVKMKSDLSSPATHTVPTATGSLLAIKADTTTPGNLYVAFSNLSNSTVYRVDTGFTTTLPPSGPVTGTAVSIAASSAHVVVATSAGLYSFDPSINLLGSYNPSGFVGVDLDNLSDVVAVDGSTDKVYVLSISPTNGSLSFKASTSYGALPARSIAVTTAGTIYAVGGPDVTSEGDPHLTTIDGVHYDFQSAGEFVLLRHTRDSKGQVSSANVGAPGYPHDAAEIQVRQYAVATTANTCVSLNSAVAARVGKHKVTYEPNLSGQPDPSGLQLRVDRKLIALGPSGIGLGDGGRIVPTSVPGELEVDFPNDTILFVTPGWWPSQSKWYLNVKVVPQQRGRGLVGNVPEGSWLPALPDGTSIGPKPTSAHDQYVELYERFADAWRVTDKTSLFDYARGTSTETFTMRGWPPETGSCVIPGTVPVEGATEEVAREACKRVPGDPANCIFDVKVTGLLNIANTYVASRNAQPVSVTKPPEPRCAGGGTVALLTFLGLLALWMLLSMRRRRWFVLR